MSAPLFLSIVMPAYNEEQNLRQFVPLVIEKVRPQVSSFELMIVDDGSVDNTVAVARELAQKYPEVRLIEHGTNRGPGSGLRTGIQESKAEWVIFIPADIAIDLDTFHRYIDATQQADVVVGVRSDRRDYSFLRKINSVVYIWMVKILFLMKQRQFNFVHMYRRKIFESCMPESQGVFITAEIMVRARDRGFRLQEVDVPYVPRAFGEATCGKPKVVGKTAGDLFHFWLRWIRGKTK